MGHISNNDCEHVMKVWKTFKYKNLGDYHGLYLRTYMLLLADIFENFRKTCLQHYGLDPAHYHASPSLSWDTLLKYTGIELELLKDYNIHLFGEKGIR